MHTSHFSIGSIVFQVSASTEILSLRQNRFLAFTVADQKSDVTLSYIKIHSLETDAASTGDVNLSRYFTVTGNKEIVSENPIPASNELVELLQSSKTKGDQQNITLAAGDSTVSVTDFGNRKITVFYLPERSSNVQIGKIGVEVFSLFLHHFNAVMIHCSCVSFNGRAAVFLARDEGGKTTAAGLCREGEILADDRILFRKNKDSSWLAHGTPWTTFLPDPESATPAAFFLLEKADEFSLTRLGSLELLSFMWEEHKDVRSLIPKIHHTGIMDLYRELSSCAPVYLMKFSKEGINQEAILECLNR